MQSESVELRMLLRGEAQISGEETGWEALI